ncbi:hypothetical protein ACFO4N_10655 [Camelliibacillus cellulosilyticus]|uniref:Uncharacterized protein n=1 Tax=Camelliibacillus cellulosilyticus TaxID=2174486 RepID=A0ABV9GPS0_9BACL
MVDRARVKAEEKPPLNTQISMKHVHRFIISVGMTGSFLLLHHSLLFR